MENKCFSTSSGDGEVISEEDGTVLKTTISLVDDNETVRQSVQRILELQDDFKILGVAINGEEAVKFVQENAPQIILMDVNMPLMDGIEATEKITSLMPEIPIIGLSLHNSPQVIGKMVSAGASAYIAKSNIVQKLCSTIRSKINGVSS